MKIFAHCVAGMFTMLPGTAAACIQMYDSCLAPVVVLELVNQLQEVLADLQVACRYKLALLEHSYR